MAPFGVVAVFEHVRFQTGDSLDSVISGSAHEAQRAGHCSVICQYDSRSSKFRRALT